MTERPVLLWRRTTSSTRSARFAGSAAVISSRRSTSGSIASARARSRTRSTASGMSRAVSRISRSGTPSSRTHSRNGSIGVLREAEVRGDVEIGDQRRLLIDRNQPGAARLGRRMHVVRFAADEDAPGVRPDRAGQDLDQGRLAGAVRAHQRVHLARQDRQRSVSQRRHGAVVLRDAGGVQERFRRHGPEVRVKVEIERGRQTSPDVPALKRCSMDYSPGPLQATICSFV